MTGLRTKSHLDSKITPMPTTKDSRLTNARRILIMSLVLSLYTLIVQFPQYYGMGSLLGGFSGSRLLRISPVFMVAAFDILGLIILGSKYQAPLVSRMDRWFSWLRGVRIFDWGLFGLTGLIFPYFLLSPAYPGFGMVLTRPWIFGQLVLLGFIFLKAASPRLETIPSLALTGLCYGVFIRIALYLPDISNQMTSLGWSEASRYYYASLYLARSIYGESVMLSSLHPSRYLLQSIPFLFNGLPIWVHRAWQDFLWLVLPFAGSLVIARRLPRKVAWLSLAIILWGYLFLNQGPVYYHLMVSVILVCAGFSADKPVRSLLFVILASIWAGISRINWFPVPGFMAAFLYVLETPRMGKTLWRYWIWPLVWIAAGLMSAFLSEAVFITISGIPVENLGSSFTSSLLWYRLFPNITYPQGVLPAICIVSIPGIVLISISLWRKRITFHAERTLFIAATLLVFFAGGIVVSVKIGGGSNLHNMDAFLVFLLIAILYFFFKGIAWESETGSYRSIPWYVTAALVFIPLLAVVQMDSEIKPFDNRPVIQDIEVLQRVIDLTPAADGEVLFITQRQFLTFGYVKGVRLVPEYEKVFLMEMAMADNQSYFAQFEKDLKAHRFSLIITEPLSYTIQGEQDVFSEENNAWISHVVSLIRRYYHETTSLPAATVSIAVPNNP